MKGDREMLNALLYLIVIIIVLFLITALVMVWIMLAGLFNEYREEHRKDK